MSEENKRDEPKVQADDSSIAIGKIEVGGDVSGNITIGNTGYTAEEVSVLIKQISSTFQPKPFDGRCPYKGLDVFEEEDAELFFGREKLVDDLVSRVKDSRTLFVTGPSGSGKSSLVRAGLIHALKSGALKKAHSENWLYATMKPGRDPIAEIARATAGLANSTNAGDEIRAKAMGDETIFARWCEIALKEGRDKRAMLFIDQFEESFTQINNETERMAFLNLLTHAATVENGRVIILFSMRSDFVSNCATYPQLNAILNQQFVQIGAMQPEELVSAIAQPALRVGLRIDPDLIAQIINEMKGEPGALPLMQFALKDLFDSQGEKSGVIALTLNDYLQRGGIHKALERHADDSFSKLNKTEQELARSIFSGLIEIGRGTQDTRRTALFDELIPANAKADDVEAIVQKLADARLITTDEQAGKDTVTISHEKLIDAWPWLKKLVNENRDVIALQNEISADAKEWDEHRRDASYLYTGGRLVNVREKLGAKKLVLSGVANEFIQMGYRKQHQGQMARFLSIAAVMASVVIGALVFSYQSTANSNRLAEQSNLFANTQQAIASTSQANAEEAQKQAKISRVGELAAQSVSLRDTNFQISLLLGVEAINELDEDIPSVRAQSVLLENSQTNPRLEQFLNGNTGPVVSAIFSPDGKTLASGTYDKDIILWDVKTRQPIDKLIGHTSIIRSIAFNPDGSIMASGSQDNTIILWNMKTRQPLKKLSGHLKSLTSVAFSPDGKTLASSSEDTTIILWDVEKGQAIGQPLSGHSRSVRSVVFSPDGKTLASGGDDGKIILWDVKTGDTVGEMQIEYIDPVFMVKVPSSVLSVAFSPDGKRLASGDKGKNVTLWNVKTGQPTQTLSRHLDIVRTLTFSPDGNTLASGSADRTIILWDVETGQFRDQLLGHSLLINSLSFSPDGGTLASGSGDATIILWDMNLRRPLSRSLSRDTDFVPILSIAFSPDGKTLASGSYDQSIILWDVEKGQSIGNQPLLGHTIIVRSVVFSPDGKTLASGSYDQTITLWNVEKRQAIVTLSGHSDPVTSIAFSPNGKTLASGSEDTTVMLWDVGKGQAIGQPLSGHTASVNSVAFSPDGRMLASGSGDGSIILWDVMTHKAIVTLSGHSVSVNSVAFSPDGKTLASGSGDRSIILWDVKTHKVIVTLGGHSDSVIGVAFSPDGKKLASGSLDQTIILWDVKNHQRIGSFSGYPAPIESLVFSQDGNTLASSSIDITLWDANEQLWAVASCQRAGRNFTRNEWNIYFPNEAYRPTCPNFPLEPAITPMETP